jgi:hypothetical protein
VPLRFFVPENEVKASLQTDMQVIRLSLYQHWKSDLKFLDKEQTALFKDPVRTAL